MYGAGVAILATLVALAVRLAVAPTADGFRHAMAPAPDGAIYTVTSAGALEVGPQGGVRALGRVPSGLPLALAADGDRLVLGTDRGVAVSADGGRTWQVARLPAGHYPAVWISGSAMLVGRWAGELFASGDAGRHWSSAGAPGGGEYSAIARSGSWYVATLMGVWSSPDLREWTEVSTATRVTALSVTGDGKVLAGDWRGAVRAVSASRRAAEPRFLGAGVWALDGSLAATIDGIRGGDRVLLRGQEVSALLSNGGRLYAGLARGPIVVSEDGGASWRPVLQG